MKTSIEHIQINISDAKVSFPFYKELLSYFEYEIVKENEECIGLSNGTTGIWVRQTKEKYKNAKFHRRATGLNHISFRVSSKEDVDKFTKEFLNKKGIKTLYETPKHFPEYTERYYAVFFEDPNRIKLEITYKQ